MAQMEAFETDFWKHANLRKVWDAIVPCEPRETIPSTLTRDAIELYCASVGEDHPMYFDEDYAKTTVYRGLIGPPIVGFTASGRREMLAGAAFGRQNKRN